MGDQSRANANPAKSRISFTAGIAIGLVLGLTLGVLVPGWSAPFRFFGHSPRETARNVNPIDLQGMEVLRIDAEQVAAGDRTRTLEGLIRRLEASAKRHVELGTSAYGKEPFPSILLGFPGDANQSPRLGAMTFTITAGRVTSRTVVFTVQQFLPSGLELGSRALVWHTWLANDVENDRLRHASDAVFRSNITDSVCKELPALLEGVYGGATPDERSRLRRLKIWVGGKTFEFPRLSDDDAATLGETPAAVRAENLASSPAPTKKPRRRRST